MPNLPFHGSTVGVAVNTKNALDQTANVGIDNWSVSVEGETEMAPVVYRPIPGSAMSFSNVFGSFPSSSLTTYLAIRRSLSGRKL